MPHRAVPSPAPAVPPASLAALLWDAADRHPDRLALVGAEGSTTYDALRRRARGAASALRDVGVCPGDRVAIFLDRGADAVGALFGAFAAGAVVTVVNERLRPRQVEYVLEHAGAAAFITSGAMQERQPRALRTAVPVLDVRTLPPDGADDAPVARAADDVAQIIYTSGSTGLPKGVVFTQGALLAGVRIVADYLGITADDRVAALLPFSSVYGLNQLLTTLWRGATLLLESSPVAHQVVTGLAANGVSVIAAVPPLWLQLLSVPDFTRAPLPTLRVAQNAGGHLPPDTVRRLRAAQPQARLFLQYGMTETFRSTFLPPDEVDARPGCMGRAMPETEILVVRDDGTPCDVGEVGELVHHGPTLASGYWNDPAATARAFRPHPLAGDAATAPRAVFSGDMVRRDAEGFLWYVSRRDRLIKTLGFRVGPDEINDVVMASGEVQESLVTAEEDAQRGDRIVAAVVLKPNGSLERLRRYCGTELPRHMQPQRYIVLEQLPRLASGKYDLPAVLASASVAPATAPVAPRMAPEPAS